MVLNSNQIQKIIPHRYPFLLVDQIVEMKDDRIVGIKCVSVNEMQFMGHFPEQHVMPGVLMIEALAQTGGVLLLSKEEYKGKVALLAGVNKARFHHQVIPGDQLILEVTFKGFRANIGFADAKATVNGEIAVKAELMFAVQA
ncbi:MAG: 3-hydroxyacyl-ACP dehydratase FabZ [Eubacterium sp.]